MSIRLALLDAMAAHADKTNPRDISVKSLPSCFCTYRGKTQAGGTPRSRHLWHLTVACAPLETADPWGIYDDAGVDMSVIVDSWLATIRTVPGALPDILPVQIGPIAPQGPRGKQFLAVTFQVIQG